MFTVGVFESNVVVDGWDLVVVHFQRAVRHEGVPVVRPNVVVQGFVKIHSTINIG